MKWTSTSRRIMRGVSTLALLGVLAGCSGGGPSDTVGQVAEQTRSLGSTLSNAIDTANDASIGFTDDAARAGAIASADAAVQRLTETVRSIGDPNLRLLAQDVARTAGLVVDELRRGNVAAAARLRVDQFVPLASQLTAMRPGSAGTETSDRSQSQSPDLIVPATLAVLVVLAVAWFLTRRARHGHDPGQPADRRSNATRAPARAWNEPHPLYAQDAAAGAPSAGMETRRSGMMRTVDFELKTLLDSTVEQLREHGWEASVVCPSVQLSGDPVRLQRALSAAVGTAKLRGADQVGLAVEVVGGDVLLTIGDDAPVEPDEATEFADRLADQVGAALGRQDVVVSWMSDDEVTLFTVSIDGSASASSDRSEQRQGSTDAPQDRDPSEGTTPDEGIDEQPPIRTGRGTEQH